MIELANNIKKQDQADKDTGLSKEELAFYYAVAENGSAKEVLGNNILRELAVYLTEVVHKNTSIDCSPLTQALAKRCLCQRGDYWVGEVKE